MAAVKAPRLERLLTVEEFALLPDNGERTELVRGRVVTMPLPVPFHGFVCSKVDRIVGGFIDSNDLGYSTCNDSGIITERDPDSMRGADFAYYSYARVPKGSFARKDYLEVSPDLAIEVKSEDDRWKDILAKVAEYLNAGITVVCVLDPEKHTARIYRADQPETVLASDQMLSFPDVLPGFAVEVRRFFE